MRKHSKCFLISFNEAEITMVPKSEIVLKVLFVY